jgi:dUTP pyrophosphatase
METNIINIQGTKIHFNPEGPKKTTILVKRLWPGAQLPVRATGGSAAFDLHVSAITALSTESNHVEYGSGLAFEFPDNVYALLFPRSSCYRKNHILANGVGLIDQDYRGEVKAVFYVEGEKLYDTRERFCQILIQGPGVNPYEVEFKEVQELGKTDRGTGGFGSTGV